MSFSRSHRCGFVLPALLCQILVCQLAIAQSKTDDSNAKDKSETTTWLGGFGSLEDDRLEWRTATLEVPKGDSNDDSEMKGKLATNNDRRYRVNISTDGEEATVTVRRRRVDRIFKGSLKDGVLFATADDGESPDRLVLRKIANMADSRLSELTGMYEVSPDHRLSFRAQGNGLAMTDYQTGQVRFLYPVADDQFVAGPAIAIPDPVQFRFQFQRGEGDVVSGVEVVQTEEQSFVAARRPDSRVEEFVYESFDGTKIAGSLYKPVGDGPFPAIVCVHGSGMATRSGMGSWPLYYADLGFAVLAVDKRGMGKSEGDYHLPNGGRDNFPHMRRRSKDVAAAVKALAKRSDIDAKRVGLSGASQAGWVIPMTVDQADVAFAIILSGGATPLSIETKYSRMASENSSGSQLPTVDEMIEELRSYEPNDPGIDAELAKIDYPCLWLYGYKDRSNPSQICEDRINGIGQKHKKDFVIKTFPDGNHGLLVCRFGGGAEYRSLSRVVPGLYENIEEWITEKQLLKE